MTRRLRFAALALAACGLHMPMPANDRYDAMCNSWVGSNVSQVIVAWGQPTVVTRLPDGTTMYEWDNVEGTDLPPDRVDHFSRAQARGAAWCATRFVANDSGAISTFTWNGNNYNDGVNFRVGCFTQYTPPPPKPAA